ncbi:MAG: metal-dependent hydrolase [bacterium]|nr:metal-dependent hydrolase [bacterium]
MLIAHLPAGYLMSRQVQKVYKTHRFLWIGLVASVFPDLDLIWFYFVDNRAYLHHSYWVHKPVFCLAFFVVCYVLYRLFGSGKKQWEYVIVLFFSNWLLHLVLDTVVGEIQWLYPYTTERYALFEVPAVYGWWLWNFVFHWSFVLEVGIVVVAGVVMVLGIGSRYLSGTRRTLNQHRCGVLVQGTYPEPGEP